MPPERGDHQDIPCLLGALEELGGLIATLRDIMGRYDEAVAAVSAMASPYGDARQDLVFIGVGMDEAAIRGALDGCLLKSKAEFAAFRQAWAAARGE